MPRIFTIIAIIRVWGKSELGERSSTDLWTCWKRKIAGFLQDCLASLIEIVILDSPPSRKSIFFFFFNSKIELWDKWVVVQSSCIALVSLSEKFFPPCVSSFLSRLSQLHYIYIWFIFILYLFLYLLLFILISYIYITLYYIWSIIKITVAWKDKKDTCEFFFYLSEK